MKKFINNPTTLVSELLDGFAIAHAELVTVKSNKIVCRTKHKPVNKVALVTLGGAGHEPTPIGFVGEGMLDYSVVGEIFAAPGPPRIIEALRLAHREAGILFIVLNHPGDVLSATMAMEMADNEGIRYKLIVTHDDIGPGANAVVEDRRGLVGCIPLFKIAGAAAEAGRGLEEVYALAQRFNNNMATLAVVMRTSTHPATGQAAFELAGDEMEIGMGQFGEPGTGRSKILSADETAELMISRLVAAVNAKAGDHLMLLLNSTGATTQMELYIVLRGCKKYLDAHGISVAVAKCGEWLTIQEMAGFQMFVAKIDDELLGYWNAPCHTPALTIK